MDDDTILKHTQRWRRSRYSARPFALTILAITLMALLAWTKIQIGDTAAPHTLSKRDITILDEECRLVHHAKDQCAFVRANCPDEEAGVISYLSLYYCRLPHARPFAFVLMTLWLALLFSTIGIAASDFFCINLNTIARMLGMSESLAGVTLLAFGNGSPDVFSTFAAFRTHAASLAVGELIGAACFITAVVSGSMALIRPFQVARKSFIRDVGFFLVAATFSMGFIVDGKLHLWEAVSMVAFYLFYVAFVVAWHWWLNLRKARRARAAAMRSHFITPGGDEEEIPEYHDDETPGGSGTSARHISVDDFSMLEHAGGHDMIDDDDNEEQRERWMGELTNNMRLNRPSMSRRNTHTPIRPSLVGALEFRAVLASLQKSRNIQSMPISLRRYSDDPTYTTAQQQHHMSRGAGPATRPPFDMPDHLSDMEPQVSRPSLDVSQSLASRVRAVSTNDIDNIRLQTTTLQRYEVPDITFQLPTPGHHRTLLNAPPSPTISLSPPPSRSSHAPNLSVPSIRPLSPNRLAPPSAEDRVPHRQDPSSASSISSPVLEPGTRPQPPSLKLAVPDATSPPIPFPAYIEYPWSAHSTSRPPSLRPPSHSASPESTYFSRDPFGLLDQARTPRWWPTSLLPPPYILLSTLFPTLTNWTDKTFFDKVLGLVASLPVFLLTITLPVVEPEKDENEGGHAEFSLDLGLTPATTPHPDSMDSHARSVSFNLPPDSSADVSLSKSKSLAHSRGGSLNISINQRPQVYITSSENVAQSPEELPSIPTPSDPRQWNRWLVIVQIFTAPFFIVLIFWANLEPENPRTLLRHTLYGLLVSLCALALILLTTTPDRPPRWRSALCFLGFAVAIAWISTIANEVVGVLRTLGVIMNMSDAILGLTIFAVGNSLGDLVADITVARLGFPIMALSACFGGPMLNILLGVGLSGCYMIITKGEHRHEKHPNQSVHFRPYHIAVSTTLVISGATLLFTLSGLLVGVPMRKWRMDKVVGWGLVTLWFLSTALNVLVEVLGYSSNVS
ncbi:ECM27 Ca2+-Na+ antiporter [Pyrenophora tritici-repentis]|uniref:ECM27, Ca2+-Na+ antiporter n=1 Tax=Pyrenophora tritici-repentis TaxID=45151 RepID=A0A834S724_9PLEO|nr:ECM27, Ca2+-Na+ antiporter [Pyrenophora tritici-repentis]KAI0577782.1 ECM27 Ca2+-Na+ antiporter [Pyrenophora tritici-repentis]KAI0577851.1 ECM27 Ca2+-Na+ antiporter [Pyrenophora tritici-repentis]KAI0607569.1 ECM27 Ca2+-Na+ antiporter [Pyrenophora tritici-repentis]KAI0619818.1 ECM27 Ca2+-Na+ antiporter [Pyrenophora tritici-repentis]